MILNSIELENIRSYEREKIDFPRGITLFEGDIGSGKSTVLMGIEFALFGLGSQKPESLLSKKATEGGVSLEFEVDGSKYTVRRKLRRKGDSVSQDAKESYLISDGQTEPLSPSELKQRILQILKFNEPADPRSESRIFRYAVFTPQEEMKQILRDSQRRLETIRKAFGVEDYRIITENATSLSRRIKEQMAAFAVRFERLEEDERSLVKSEADLQEMQSVIEGFEQQKLSLDKKIADISKEVEALKEQSRQKEHLQTQQDKIQDQINNKTATLSILESQVATGRNDILKISASIADLSKILPPTSKTLSDLDSEISSFSELRDKIRDGRSKIASLECDIDKLRLDLGEFVNLSKSEPERIKESLDEIRSKIDSGNREREDLERRRAVLEKERKDILLLLGDLQNLGAKCPHCEHDLTEEHKRKVEDERNLRLRGVEEGLLKMGVEIAEIAKTVAELKKDESSKDQKLRQIERTAPLREQWFEKTGQMSALKQQMPELESKFTIPEEPSFAALQNEDAVSYLRRLRDAQKEYEGSKQRLAELESQKSKLELATNNAQSQTDDIKSSISALGKELESISSRLEAFSGIEEKLVAKSKEQTGLERNLDDTKAILIKNTQILANEKSRMTDLETKIKEAKIWQQKHAKFSNYYYWLREFFIPTIDKIEKQVLLSIQQNFNETYRKWYSVLIDDVTKESKIDEDFTPLVEQDGFVQDVDYLSGGEKTSIALAYRLALNSMMRQESDGLKSNLLILDEPTDGFSKAQLSKVRNLLEDLRSQQIILVSHEKELETYADNIFHITKDSGVSKVLRLGS